MKKVNLKLNLDVSLTHLRSFIETIDHSFYDSPIIEALKKALEKAEKKDKNSIIGNKLRDESLKKDGDEYVSPEYWFFAIRPLPEDNYIRTPGEEKENAFELHTCFKWDWYLNNQKYPAFQNANNLSYSDLNLDGLGESGDCDGNVSWWFGKTAEEGRKVLLELGMEEKESLIADYEAAMDDLKKNGYGARNE